MFQYNNILKEHMQKLWQCQLGVKMRFLVTTFSLAICISPAHSQEYIDNVSHNQMLDFVYHAHGAAMSSCNHVRGMHDVNPITEEIHERVEELRGEAGENALLKFDRKFHRILVDDPKEAADLWVSGFIPVADFMHPNLKTDKEVQSKSCEIVDVILTGSNAEFLDILTSIEQLKTKYPD